ncbi:MAG: hypothetical protein KF784_11345 [Fimbriimonadaceae bacterium]|nr:hypothetical protein [Fimbriimonadaceae bacterium]
MNIDTLIADSMWEMLPAIAVPIVIFMIPIVAILTKHQQKMAELIHGNRNIQGSPEMDMLRREVAELKTLVHQQTMMIDEIAGNQRRLGSGSTGSVQNQNGDQG